MNRFRSAAAAALLLLTMAACASAPSAGGAPSASAATDASAVADPQTARAKARKAIERNADDPDAWFLLGLGWQRSGEAGQAGAADSAVAAFDRVLELDENHVRALVHRGLALEDAGKFDPALASYQKASEVAPEDALPWVNMGSILYFQYKRTYEAKTALTKALELDPKNADARFNLGVMFADASMFREARKEWEAVVELKPDSPAGALAAENLEKIRPLLEDAETPAETP